MSAPPTIRVLLVDADTERAERFCTMLEREPGFACLKSGALDPAIFDQGAQRPHAILLSLSLPQHPGLAGLALAQALAPRTPIIVVAAPEQETLALKAVHQGADDYLLEPLIYPTLVVRSVRHAIERNERRNAEEALLRTEMRYRALFEESRDSIFMTDVRGRIIETNPAMQEMLGYASAELMTVPIEALYADPSERQLFLEEWSVKGRVTDFEARFRRSDGSSLWCVLSITEQHAPSGEVVGYQGIAHDINDRKRAEEQLVHNAFHDVLTGLPNRARFADRLDRALVRWQRHRDRLFAVLFLDLDRFKVVNDSLGHSAGDELLIRIGHILSDCIRDEDTVARLGGDEFAILLDQIDSVKDAVLVANRIHTSLERPLLIAGQNVFTSCSIGIALPHFEHDRADDLLRNADLAMYHAKAEGPARHAIYAPAMHSAAVNVMELDMDLRGALQNNEFVLHYQPIYLLESGRISGFEALVRWRHPRRGLLMPADFLQRAEDTGLITQIGRWVIHEACAQMRGWQRFAHSNATFLSLNISGKQLAQPDFVADVAQILARYGVSGSQLMFELTETSLMQNPDACAVTITRLRELGVRFCIDDFGTGYSSLSYLHRLPINGLKIDRSFIARMSENGEGRELVKTIVALAANLGLEAVAEGVETEIQFSSLRQLRPKYVQGFFLSRPLEPAAALAMLAA